MFNAASIAAVSASRRTISSLLDNRFACILVVWCESTSSPSLGGISRGFAGRFSSPILQANRGARPLVASGAPTFRVLGMISLWCAPDSPGRSVWRDRSRFGAAATPGARAEAVTAAPSSTPSSRAAALVASILPDICQANVSASLGGAGALVG